jgi:hypothetical protein
MPIIFGNLLVARLVHLLLQLYSKRLRYTVLTRTLLHGNRHWWIKMVLHIAVIDSLFDFLSDLLL